MLIQSPADHVLHHRLPLLGLVSLQAMDQVIQYAVPPDLRRPLLHVPEAGQGRLGPQHVPHAGVHGPDVVLLEEHPILVLVHLGQGPAGQAEGRVGHDELLTAEPIVARFPVVANAPLHHRYGVGGAQAAGLEVGDVGQPQRHADDILVVDDDWAPEPVPMPQQLEALPFALRRVEVEGLEPVVILLEELELRLVVDPHDLLRNAFVLR
mmetsp:Transcript_148612/g.259728  ORF Transcript_148612/g.259728 Transcript_148612/m.259728 type:complete len:209 (-) Transcript_148612:1434-2060(-)